MADRHGSYTCTVACVDLSLSGYKMALLSLNQSQDIIPDPVALLDPTLRLDVGYWHNLSVCIIWIWLPVILIHHCLLSSVSKIVERLSTA